MSIFQEYGDFKIKKKSPISDVTEMNIQRLKKIK